MFSGSFGFQGSKGYKGAKGVQGYPGVQVITSVFCLKHACALSEKIHVNIKSSLSPDTVFTVLLCL